MTEPRSLLRALKRERMHVEPRALEMSRPPVRSCFAHVWAPADLVLQRLAAWPPGLLAFWLAAPRGHIVFSAQPSAYPATVTAGGILLPAAARLGLEDLARDPRPANEALARLMDHLLGSLAVEGGPWLSDGAGATPALRAVGERLHALARLGYGPSEPHAYFAWAFTTYWHDRRALNAADPLVERLLRTTLCHPAFWEGLAFPSSDAHRRSQD